MHQPAHQQTASASKVVQSPLQCNRQPQYNPRLHPEHSSPPKDPPRTVIATAANLRTTDASQAQLQCPPLHPQRSHLRTTMPPNENVTPANETLANVSTSLHAILSSSPFTPGSTLHHASHSPQSAVEMTKKMPQNRLAARKQRARPPLDLLRIVTSGARAVSAATTTSQISSLPD